MKAIKKQTAAFLAVAILVIGALAGCGGTAGSGNDQAGNTEAAAQQSQTGNETGESGNADTKEAAGEYYLDLTDLGMKLTIYLRLSEDGQFLFSNTPAFEVNKSSGTYQKSGDNYVMVFTSVNGEEKSISDGLTSNFVLTEEGNLDFTVCERIYYGSASATTTSADNPDAKLIGLPIPDDYEMPSDESLFQTGVYVSEDGACKASFFDDFSYLLVQGTEKDCRFEIGNYGVSTSQLAMTPDDGNRISNEVVDENHLKLQVPADGEERIEKSFNKSEEQNVIASFTGSGTLTGTTDSFESILKIYDNGVYETVTGDITESGLIMWDLEEGYFRIFPDHPTEGTRGLKQVSSVPNGTIELNKDGKLVLSDFRIRTSEGLGRDKCVFTEE